MHFTVTLQPSGRTFPCGPATEVLRAGLAAGVPLRYSCRSGVCRTCRAHLVTGVIDHGNVHPNYLSEAEKAQGVVHLCSARPLADCVFSVGALDPAQLPARQMPARVLSVERPAPDVAVLRIGLPPNEPLHFRAGQFLQVLLDDGVARSYSIATCPRAEGVRQLELHLRHLPGGRFTDHVFGHLQPRDLLRIEAPQGSFFLREDSTKPMVMLASGTGFAPIQSLVTHSLALGARRPIHLYWGVRRAADLYRHALAMQWATQHPHIRYTPVLSDATVACGWQGRRGLVHRAVLEDLPDLSGYQVYACGAPAMVEAARRDFGAEAGLPALEFHADAFVTQAERAATATIPSPPSSALV